MVNHAPTSVQPVRISGLQRSATGITKSPCNAAKAGRTIHCLAAYHRKINQYQKTYEYARSAKLIPLPENGLFINKDIYEWQILDEKTAQRIQDNLQFALSKTLSDK